MAYSGGNDPLYKKYAAPVVVDQTGNSTYSLNILSTYLPIVYDVTWAGDLTTDPIAKKRMKAEVYYGSTPTLLGTQIKTSILVGGVNTYRFNVAEMLKTTLNSEIYNNITSDQINTGNDNIVMPYYIVYTPMYIDILGVEREDDSLTDSTAYCTSAIKQNLVSSKIFSNSDTYVTRDSFGSTKKFLTNAPNNKKIRANETEQLTFFNLSFTDTIELNYTVYNLAGTPTNYTKSLVDCTAYKYGTLTISDSTASCLLNGITNISKLDVWLENNSGVVLSEKRTYIIDTKCSDGYRLVWVNEFGATDKYTFDAHKSRNFKVEEREVYKTPIQNEPSISDRSLKVLGTKGGYSYSCTSKFIGDDLDWFTELLTTNECYWEKEANVLVPIIITSSDQVIEDNTGLINVTIDFKTSQEHITR